MTIELNADELLKRLREAKTGIEKGAKQGMMDALELWKVEATDIAPLYKKSVPKTGRRRKIRSRAIKGGTLRQGIKIDGVKQKGKTFIGQMSTTASNKGFNYAYYIHEVYKKKSFKNPSTAGTVPKFLDKSKKEHMKDMQRLMMDGIQDELTRLGW